MCKDCRKQFQHAYQNRGSDPRLKKQIISSLIHGSGIRDCAAVFQVSQVAVLHLIIRYAKRCSIVPRRKHYQRILIDEFYSFVQNKDKKVWIFYAYVPERKEIIAFTMGKRDIRQVRFLMLKIKHLNIQVDYCVPTLFRAS